MSRNNVLFREANEGIRHKADQARPPMAQIPFVCECVREDCRELVAMPLETYAAIRARPTHFITAPEHEVAEASSITVVERTETYIVVEKLGASRTRAIEDWERGANAHE